MRTDLSLVKSLMISLSLLSLSCSSLPKGLRTISVTGQGIVSSVPDQVEIAIGIENNGKIVKDVKKENDQNMARILNAAKEFKVAEKDLQSEYVRIDAEYVPDERGNAPKKSYVARRTVRILLRDMNSYDALIAKLFDAGANVLNNVDFRSSKRLELESEARKAAIANAKKKAALMANELGLSLGKAVEISDQAIASEAPSHRGGMMAMAKMEEDSSGPTLAAGQLEVSSQVGIIFELN
ncbi:MAG: DUF541 domain-containing protein [Proteobacteria bacterium]|nr:MAG: DUF541 domain-containing protein [Pseudomonadota bacterium]